MGLFQWFKRLFLGEPQAPVAPLPEPRGASPFPPGTGPSRLIVLRHAEKSGDRRDPHLSLPGRQRAEQLVTYIPQTFGQPQFLIAARTSGKSRRPAETLEPLAAALGLEIRAKHDDDEVGGLISHLRTKPRYAGRIGIICWRHSELPRLLQRLGAAPDSFPQSWDEGDYTTLVDITFPGNSEVITQRIKMPF